MDNKFGTCCGCPAIMNDSRNFTVWQPHHSYYLKLKEASKAENELMLRKTIIEQPDIVVNLNNELTNNLTCNKENLNIDSSDYHNMFNENIINFVNQQSNVDAYGGKEFSSK